jgi:hypothetical protein
MLAILFAASIVFVLLAWAEPSWDDALAWLLGMVLAVLAGSRTGGFDYDDHVGLIEAVRSLAGEDLTLQLLAAKDPLFFLFIRAAGWLGEDARIVFALVAVVGVGAKVAASRAVRGRRTLLIALYALLLSPGLEFAAIRAGLAVGLAMWALSLMSRGTVMLTLLSVLGHASMLVVALGRLLQRYRAVMLAISVLAMPLLLHWSAEWFGDSDRFGQYQENIGSAGALLLPLVTAVAWLAARSCLKAGWPSVLLRPEVVGCTSFCIALALLLALPSVTVSFRTLEISWVLMLWQLVALGALRVGRPPALRLEAAWALMLFTLALSNVLRGTWAEMLPLPA